MFRPLRFKFACNFETFFLEDASLLSIDSSSRFVIAHDSNNVKKSSSAFLKAVLAYLSDLKVAYFSAILKKWTVNRGES